MSLIEIRKTLEVMITPGDVVELRIFDKYNKKYCGWFNDVIKMAEAALSHNDTAEGIYYTCNACVPDMLAIANNKTLLCKTASSEKNIIRRRIIGIDIDPVRNPVKISSTDNEKLLSYNRAIEVRAWLSSHGFSLPVFGDSGNGYHLDYFVDLPVTEDIKKIYENFLAVLKIKFPKDAVDVQGFADANRIWKVYGTMVRKGENMPDRPHRQSRLLEIPDTRELVTIELLKRIADMLPKDEFKVPSSNRSNTGGKAWDASKLKKWLDEHGAVIERTKNDGSITRYVLEACLMNPEHEGHKEAEVHINEAGMIGYKCHHDSCKNVTWKMIRAKIDPEYKKKKERSTQNVIKSNGAFDYIDRITEKNPIYYDEAGQFWLWCDEAFYKPVDNTEILLILLRDIADPSIIKTMFKGELLEAARLKGRDARVKPVPNTWIHLQNGVYDTRTGAINKATPEYLFTYPIPHKLSNSEDTPTIDKLFSEWVAPEKVPLLNEIAAYCLYNGYPIHRMFVLLGRGRNGKGQYRDFVVNLVGTQNRSASTLEQLINSRFETARLFNKKVCTMGEVNYSLLDRTAVLKMLSGGDPIPGEKKNKTPFDFVNTAKLLINTNSLPQTSDKTDAFYSRCIIIEFWNQWLLGKDIIDTIPDEEYDNFLTKSLRVLSELLDRGVFSNEGNIQDKEKEYERLSNPLTQFINIYYDKDINGKVAAWRLMDKYIEYCIEKGYRKPESKSGFNKLLKVNYEVDKQNLIDEEDGIYKNWVWVLGIKPKVLPVLPVLPDFPLVSSIRLPIEILGNTGKTGKTTNSVPDENLPFDSRSYTTKNGQKVNLTNSLLYNPELGSSLSYNPELGSKCARFLKINYDQNFRSKPADQDEYLHVIDLMKVALEVNLEDVTDDEIDESIEKYLKYRGWIK